MARTFRFLERKIWPRSIYWCCWVWAGAKTIYLFSPKFQVHCRSCVNSWGVYSRCFILLLCAWNSEDKLDLSVLNGRPITLIWVKADVIWGQKTPIAVVVQIVSFLSKARCLLVMCTRNTSQSFSVYSTVDASNGWNHLFKYINIYIYVYIKWMKFCIALLLRGLPSMDGASCMYTKNNKEIGNKRELFHHLFSFGLASRDTLGTLLIR